MPICRYKLTFRNNNVNNNSYEALIFFTAASVIAHFPKSPIADYRLFLDVTSRLLTALHHQGD